MSALGKGLGSPGTRGGARTDDPPARTYIGLGEQWVGGVRVTHVRVHIVCFSNKSARKTTSQSSWGGCVGQGKSRECTGEEGVLGSDFAFTRNKEHKAERDKK